jgi:hypothetical protein
MSITNKPIEQILSELKGRAKELYLSKWRKWILELAKTYEVEDIKSVIGWDINDNEQLEKALLEHGHGLTEFELFNHFDEMFSKEGRKSIAKRITDEAAALLQKFELEKRDPIKALQLPSEVESELREIIRNPELDSGRAYNIVFNVLTSQGVPKEDADMIAKKASQLIPEVPKEERGKTLREYVIGVKVLAQRRLTEFIEKEQEVKRQRSEAIKEIQETRLVKEADPEQLIPSSNLLEAKISKDLDEAEARLVDWAIAKKYTIIPSPFSFSPMETKNVFIIYLPNRKPKLRYSIIDKQITIFETTQPSIVYIIRFNSLIFQRFR